MGVTAKSAFCGGCSNYFDDPVLDQKPIQFQDEGVDLGGEGTVRIINFVGAAVEAVRSGNTLTITISGSGGGGAPLTNHPIASGAPSGTIALGARYYLTGSPGVILGEDVAEGTVMEARTANPTLRAHWYFNFGGT